MIRKFKGVALAALALMASAAAQAQSSVTLYGVIDEALGSIGASATGNYQRVHGKALRLKGIGNGGLTTSFIGFSGVEDMGNGLKAKFKLESYIDAPRGRTLMQQSLARPDLENGPTGFWSRNSWVGLSSNEYGTLTLGRTQTPMYDTLVAFNPFAGSSVFSVIKRFFYLSYGHATGDNGTEWANVATYYTPNILEGVSATLQYRFADDTPADYVDNRRKRASFGGNISYTIGPFAIAAAASQFRSDRVYGRGGQQNNWLVGASYDFGFAKLFAQYGQAHDTNKDSETYKLADGITRYQAPYGRFRDRNWQFGFSAPIGPGTLLATVGQQRHKLDREQVINIPYYKGRDTAFSIAYDYPLSSRTDIYAGYGYDKAKVGGMSREEKIATNRNNLGTASSGAIGIRHRF